MTWFYLNVCDFFVRSVKLEINVGTPYFSQTLSLIPTTFELWLKAPFPPEDLLLGWSSFSPSLSSCEIKCLSLLLGYLPRQMVAPFPRLSSFAVLFRRFHALGC